MPQTAEMIQTQNAIAEAWLAEVPDEQNPQCLLSGAATQLLVKALAGEFDLLALVRLELANRGLDENGKWVGFPKAAQIHGTE